MNLKTLWPKGRPCWLKGKRRPWWPKVRPYWLKGKGRPWWPKGRPCWLKGKRRPWWSKGRPWWPKGRRSSGSEPQAARSLVCQSQCQCQCQNQCQCQCQYDASLFLTWHHKVTISKRHSLHQKSCRRQTGCCVPGMSPALLKNLSRCQDFAIALWISAFATRHNVKLNSWIINCEAQAKVTRSKGH